MVFLIRTNKTNLLRKVLKMPQGRIQGKPGIRPVLYACTWLTLITGTVAHEGVPVRYKYLVRYTYHNHYIPTRTLPANKYANILIPYY